MLTCWELRESNWTELQVVDIARPAAVPRRIPLECRPIGSQSCSRQGYSNLPNSRFSASLTDQSVLTPVGDPLKLPVPVGASFDGWTSISSIHTLGPSDGASTGFSTGGSTRTSRPMLDGTNTPLFSTSVTAVLECVQQSPRCFLGGPGRSMSGCRR